MKISPLKSEELCIQNQINQQNVMWEQNFNKQLFNLFVEKTCYMLCGLELMWDVYTHNIGECFKFHFPRISVLFIMVTLRSEYFFPLKEGLSDPNDGVNQLH